MSKTHHLVLFLLSFGLAPLISAQTISAKAIVWNVESGDADPSFVATQMASKGDIDLWGLSEVQNTQWLEIFEGTLERATGSPYSAVLGSNTHADKLAILYREDRFALMGEPFEIEEVQDGRAGLRPALTVHLKGTQTGQEFFFVVNHFKAGGGSRNINTRVRQARAMNAWTNNQTIPVVMGGDLNTPFRVATGQMPIGLKTLVEEGPFEWIEPEIKVKSQASRFNSILDYILAANHVGFWEAEAVILKRDGNEPVAESENHQFADDNQSTDHRPVLATFTLRQNDAISELEEEIAALEARLAELRRRLELLTGNP